MIIYNFTQRDLGREIGQENGGSVTKKKRVLRILVFVSSGKMILEK